MSSNPEFPNEPGSHHSLVESGTDTLRNPNLQTLQHEPTLSGADLFRPFRPATESNDPLPDPTDLVDQGRRNGRRAGGLQKGFGPQRLDTMNRINANTSLNRGTPDYASLTGPVDPPEDIYEALMRRYRHHRYATLLRGAVAQRREADRISAEVTRQPSIVDPNLAPYNDRNLSLGVWNENTETWYEATRSTLKLMETYWESSLAKRQKEIAARFSGLGITGSAPEVLASPEASAHDHHTPQPAISAAEQSSDPSPQPPSGLNPVWTPPEEMPGYAGTSMITAELTPSKSAMRPEFVEPAPFTFGPTAQPLVEDRQAVYRVDTDLEGDENQLTLTQIPHSTLLDVAFPGFALTDPN